MTLRAQRVLPLLALSAALFGQGAIASDIGLVGLFPGKALFVVDNRQPKMYEIGQNVADGVKLVAVDHETATVSNKGRRETYAIGQYVSASNGNSASSTALEANSDGHYVATAQINGRMIQGLIDTGATLVALPASDAIRMGINYHEGTPLRISTANGQTLGFRVTLDTMRIGDIELHQIDAVVQETGLPFALFGMSFLNRTEMRRDGHTMVLTKRY